MSYEFCPKCGTNLHGAVECKHCGRMPTAFWKYRTAPPRGMLKKLKAKHRTEMAAKNAKRIQPTD